RRACTISGWGRKVPTGSGGSVDSNVVESTGRGWRWANASSPPSRTRNRCIRWPWSGMSGVHWRCRVAQELSSMANRSTLPVAVARTVAAAWSGWYSPLRYAASTAFHDGHPHAVSAGAHEPQGCAIERRVAGDGYRDVGGWGSRGPRVPEHGQHEHAPDGARGEQADGDLGEPGHDSGIAHDYPHRVGARGAFEVSIRAPHVRRGDQRDPH